MSGGEEMQERVVQTFHAFQHLIMEELAPYIWGQPESVGRVAVIGAVAACAHLADQLQAAGERDLRISTDVFQSAVDLCSDHQLSFDFTVKPHAEIQRERKSRMH